jgi:hypothetical protein
VNEHHVVLPDDSGCIVRFQQEGLTGIANIRLSLREFEPKIIFPWHLSLVVELQDLADNGMPSTAEQKVSDEFGEVLEAAFIGDPQHPNALFLARITWNGTRELVYRVYEPEPIDGYLRGLIDSNSSPRPFDYRMEHDPEWKRSEWHLNVAEKA